MHKTQLLLFIAMIGTPILASADNAALINAGKQTAFDRTKGNCLACHQIEGGESPGNIGPPLMAMKIRYPERQKLYERIWDATVFNPETSMPPFGRHQILTESELEQVVEFIWSK